MCNLVIEHIIFATLCLKVHTVKIIEEKTIHDLCSKKKVFSFSLIENIKFLGTKNQHELFIELHSSKSFLHNRSNLKVLPILKTEYKTIYAHYALNRRTRKMLTDIRWHKFSDLKSLIL